MNWQVMRQTLSLALQSMMLPIGLLVGRTVEASQSDKNKEEPCAEQRCCPWLKLFLALGGLFCLLAMLSKLLGKRHHHCTDECEDCCCEDEDCDCEDEDCDCDCEDEDKDCECSCEEVKNSAEAEQSVASKIKQNKHKQDKNISQSGFFNIYFYFNFPKRKAR